jgi:hypothetical protein
MFPSISLVSFFVPHLSPNLSCPQFPMLPALHFSYTFTALTNLAPLAIKLQPTSTSSIYVSLCYPDDICLCPSTGFITPPSIPLSLPPLLLFFLFSSSSLLTEQTYFPVTRTLKHHLPNSLPLASSCLLLPPLASRSHLILTLSSNFLLLPGYISTSRASSLLSSHSIFLSRHFTRHELRLLSPAHLFPSPSPSSPLIFIFILIFNFHFNFHFHF